MEKVVFKSTSFGCEKYVDRRLKTEGKMIYFQIYTLSVDMVLNSVSKCICMSVDMVLVCLFKRYCHIVL